MSASSASRVPYRPYGTAIYRRELRVRVEPGRADGELIDDFHHFRAWVAHDGERVTEVGGDAARYPWATCAEAAGPLRALVGASLERMRSLRAPAGYTDRRRQCTHLFDAASLALVRAARGAGDVVYRIAIPDRVEGRARVELERDGQPVLLWDLDGATIAGPEPFAGRGLGAGLADWAEAEFDADLAEAVLLLQRACTIAAGRTLDLESFPDAAAVAPRPPTGQCYTYQAGTVERASRMLGTVRDMTRATDLRRVSLGAP